ncbi:related to GIT1-Glycerophosphoinositol transporter also able to mediate low-affinity phosphate [Phialocephala subalpina]|uniref:Related to GIT1-Glycerophosphoinositol transporter also able to mediate low-affinity phosphate n=1 Tax=Phialocephala subalpina TaxID=576137 RepID=A0A1L7WYB2_9HELO|nr:related to GIT1-Glycerophosphoinositol transporter also able to mediate low-affinity phosphate [Phialocephala subalpina]
MNGYNMAVIGNITLFLQKTIGVDVLTNEMRGQISNSFLIGQIMGLLGFGILIDRMGRKVGALFTTLILITGIAISTTAHGTTPLGLIWMLIIGRGIAGVGAGGEYPVCTATAVEAADDQAATSSHRGFITAAATILSIDLGFVLASLIPMLLLLITKDQHYELIWRLSIGLGAILPLSIFYYRLMMKTSSTYEKYGQSTISLPYKLLFRKYWKTFLGTAGPWSMYNCVAVPFAIFASTVVSSLNPNGSLTKEFAYSTLIQSFCLPGGLVGGWCADRFGRKRTLVVGFSLQAVLGFFLGGAIQRIQSVPALFLVLYGVFLFLGEAGPGSTVFVISAEVYPTVIRGVMIGISAAVAKAFSAISTQVFNPILAHWEDDVVRGQQVVFLLGSMFCVFGAILAHLFVEEVPRGQDLSQAEAIFERYLLEDGEGHKMID